MEHIMVTSNEYIQEREYWTNRLSKEFTIDYLSYDIIKNIYPEKEEHELSFLLSKDIGERILNLSNDSMRRVYIILVSEVMLLCKKYSGHNDLLIGVPLENKKSESDLMNNVFVLRTEIKESFSFKECLLQNRKNLIEGMENQNYPIKALVRDLNLSIDEKGFPLFDVLVLLSNIHQAESVSDINNNISFHFTVKDSGEIGCVIKYNSICYSKDFINKIKGHFNILLKNTIFDIEKSVEDISVLSNEEKKIILHEFNQTEKSYNLDSSITSVFEDLVAKSPDSICAVQDNKYITHSKLNEKVNQFANYLIELGVKNEEVICLLLDKSFDILISIFGILKTGATYLPVDPINPKERINYMVTDSNSKYVITSNKYLEQFDNQRNHIINIEADSSKIITRSKENLSVNIYPDNSAYVIYTSGSTGFPKGVVVEHHGVINLKNWQSEYFDVSANSRISQFFSYSFDGAVGEIFMSTLNGATLVFLDKDNLQPERMLASINKYNISVVVMVPSLIEYINPNDINRINKFTLISVGEICNEKLAKKWAALANFVNAYGPTEYTVYSHSSKIEESSIGENRSIPIGTSISNTKTYILNGNHNIVPIGEIGEIYISGIGIAREYLRNKDITLEKFIPNIFYLKQIIKEHGVLEVDMQYQDIKVNPEKKLIRTNKEPSSYFKEDIIGLVKNIDSDLKEKTVNFIEEHQLDTQILNGFSRYLFEGINNSYVSVLYSDEILKKIIPFDNFVGKKGTDFGIGDGKIQQKLMSFGAEMNGLDYNPFFIQKARDSGMKAYMTELDLPYDEFKQQSNVNNESQDFVISTLVLDRIANPLQYMRNMFHVLKTDGYYAIQTILPLIPFDDEDVKHPIVYTPDYNRITPGKKVEDDKFYLISILHELGLDDINIYEFPYTIFTSTGSKTYNVYSFSGRKVSLKNKYSASRYYSKLYRTGDLGRFLSNGSVEFAGRVDNQIKIKGYRIELSEIENQINKCDNVLKSIVLCVENAKSDKTIVAYVIPEGEIDTSSIENTLNEILPNYMIPNQIIQIDKFPLNTSGKIDIKLLSDQYEEKSNITNFEPASNQLESELIEIWKEELGIEEVGIHNSFFNVGGDSIKSIRLITVINEKLNCDLEIIDLYTNNTIEKLSKKIFGEDSQEDSNNDKLHKETLNELNQIKDSAKII